MFKWLGPAMPADSANSARLRALYPLLFGKATGLKSTFKRPLQIATVEVAVGGRNRKADPYGSL